MGRDRAASALHDGVLGPNRFAHCLHALVFRRRQFVAWVGLLRRQGRPPFSTAAASALNAKLPALKADLIAAHDLDQAATPPLGHVIFAADGTVEDGSTSGARWLAFPDVRTGLAKRVRDLHEGRSTTRTVPRADVVVEPMDAVGPTRYLATITSLPVLERPFMDDLTPRQRQVAALVVAGKRNPEVALELGLAEETVRTHLRAAYERFGVADRSDLARCWDDPS